jgi:hypothetical protein
LADIPLAVAVVEDVPFSHRERYNRGLRKRMTEVLVLFGAAKAVASHRTPKKPAKAPAPFCRER